ncbi:MAG TPA: hypothetical protein PLQ93_06030 [Bacteroidia bacterium]|nr:hypothetical protein [Bacteroidia bacterium]
MKVVFSIVVLIGLCLQQGARFLTLMDFVINRAEITARYCVNKSKPRMHCKGKCHLKKKLAEQDEKTNQTKRGTGERAEDVLISQQHSAQLRCYYVGTRQSFSFSHTDICEPYHKTLYRPPAL